MKKSGMEINIQDFYFNQIRKQKAGIVLTLMNGLKVEGKLKAFDRYVLVVESREGEMVIFKHAVASVSFDQAFKNTIKFSFSSQPHKD
jgi:host factor-I protein